MTPAARSALQDDAIDAIDRLAQAGDVAALSRIGAHAQALLARQIADLVQRGAIAPAGTVASPAKPDAVDAAWRAAVDAASEVLGDQFGRAVSTLDRQAIAFAIGETMTAKLTAPPKRCWTGTLDQPCWNCGRDHREHRARATRSGGLELLCPPGGLVSPAPG